MEWGRTEVVRHLLARPSAAAIINGTDDDGRTALWHACYRGREDIVRLLLKHRADLTIADNNGATPTAAAEHRGQRECTALLKVCEGLSPFPWP
jgi:ankyrin repeat protein